MVIEINGPKQVAAVRRGEMRHVEVLPQQSRDIRASARPIAKS